ncbi:MAG TPA: DUF58 domain-containing protein [Gemmatimonadaceae bacterium]|nr:DUF58 domain-containing protein [Gemmatimonadaceae bacterium]
MTAGAPQAPYRELASGLDPRVLARIDNLEFVARAVVEGFLNGLHRSVQLGFSTEFAQHRAYVPGDDLRRLDWRVFARTDRYLIREYEAETNTNVVIALDVSKSMAYGSGGVTKLDVARVVGASLAYLAHRQRDRVGFAAFASDVAEYIPPAAAHFQLALHALGRAQPRERGELAAPLARLGDALRRRGIIVVLSDCYEAPSAVADAMGGLRTSGHDVVVMHVLDRAELEFPFDEAATFEDLETRERVPLVPARMRERYRASMRAHLDELERKLLERAVDYVVVNTSQPIEDMLFGYLVRRERLRRVR